MSDNRGVFIQIKGLEECIARLKALGKKNANKAIRKGLRAGAKVTTAAARNAAPVKTGLLKRNIKTRAAKRKRNRIGVVTTLGAGFFKGETFYGAFQEFGWKAGKRVSKGMGDTRKQIPGKHFMEDSAKRVARRAGQVAVDEIKSQIEVLARG